MHANASVDDIAAFLDRLLDTANYRDSEPDANGLIYRAGPGISKFAVAVNTSLTTIVGAAKCGAQLLVVHHTSWPEIDLHLRDEKFAALEAAGISLYAAHNALDAAGPGISNGWVLSEALGIDVTDTFVELGGGHAGVVGNRDGAFEDLIRTCSQVLGVQVEAHQHAKTANRIAVIPGGAPWTSWMDDARKLGADTYLTGEGSMYTRMFARETGMNLIFGTHHATEAPGIRALGDRIAAESALPFEFISDSPDVF